MLEPEKRPLTKSASAGLNSGPGSSPTSNPDPSAPFSPDPSPAADPYQSPPLPPNVTPLLALYSGALLCALMLSAPWWLRELRRDGKYREGLRERLGILPRARFLEQEPPAPDPAPPSLPTIWIHAVSVGEVLAAAPLVSALQQSLPAGRIVVSTTTRTGQALARSRFGARSVFFYPADFAFAVRPWLRLLQPSAIVLVESEFWPRFLWEAARARVPVAVVNARISARSWPRYRRLRLLWRPLLRTLAFAQAQSALDAERLRALGVRSVSIGGNLKYDLPTPPPSPLLHALRATLPAQVPILVAGSTLPGEEALLLDALPADAVLLVAPRQPERFAEVAALLAAGARPFHRLSAWRMCPEPILPSTLLLLDSVGELATLYALATLSLVGGGFLHPRGHNPIEPAALGKPVIIGPHFVDFQDIVHDLQSADALRISTPQELKNTIAELLADPSAAQRMGNRAQEVCAAQRGATTRAAEAILALLAPLDPVRPPHLAESNQTPLSAKPVHP